MTTVTTNKRPEQTFTDFARKLILDSESPSIRVARASRRFTARSAALRSIAKPGND
jgi:hypothetical protein